MRLGKVMMGAVGLAISLGSWTTVHGEDLNYYLDGQKFYQSLSGGGLGEEFALGYVAGVSDTAQAHGMHCAPNTLLTGTLADVVEKELRDIPEYRMAPATHLIALTMMVHWPCKK